MCLWFASGCRLCKSWAGASSQLGGQTRKQMDPFGLNPSHAISSSWPCPSNQQAFLQHRWRGVCVYVEVWGMGGAWNSTSTKQEDRQEPERSSKREGERGTFPYRLCVCWTVLTYGSCLHVGAPCLLCPVLSFFLFRYSLLSALSAKPVVCIKKSLPFLGCRVTTPCEIYWLSAVSFTHFTPPLSCFGFLAVGEVLPANMWFLLVPENLFFTDTPQLKIFV